MASHFTDTKSGGLGDSVKNFLKGRKVPGTVRLTRHESEAQQSHTGSASVTPHVPVDSEQLHVKASTSYSESDQGEAKARHEEESAAEALAALKLRAGSGSSAGGRTASNPGSPAVSPAPRRGNHLDLRSMSDSRRAKFLKILGEPVVDLDALRELAWSGVPSDLRPVCWQLLLGYIPPNKERREAIIARKRSEYRDMVPEYYESAARERSADEVGALRQVAVDVPRTAPGVPFFHMPQIQKSLERILFLWGIRHPASGYVQGINDLVTPFLAVFLSEHSDASLEGGTLPIDLPEGLLLGAEADSYWCLCKLLDGIQDHYTYAQPGIQRAVFRLKELVRRIDEIVAQHLEDQGVEFLQFTFRWVNCLLIREVPFPAALRLWDTYLAEGARMKDFLIYVAAAFLLSWSSEIRRLDFQELVLFLQKLPTHDWSEKEVEMVLSRAYMWRASFGNAQSHLSQ
eukprot:jgi/Botrbrau1/3781/Bobra.0183s0016.1